MAKESLQGNKSILVFGRHSWSFRSPWTHRHSYPYSHNPTKFPKISDSSERLIKRPTRTVDRLLRCTNPHSKLHAGMQKVAPIPKSESKTIDTNRLFA